MKVQSIAEIKDLLKNCRATHVQNVAPTGFYQLKAHAVRFPDGRFETREYLDKKPAAVVLPITTEGNIVFVVQPISNVAEGSLLELPAGYSNSDEPPQATAVRELLEETGYSPTRVESLSFHYQDPGLIREPVHTFIAFGCQKTDPQKLDHGEYIKYLEIPPHFIPELTKTQLLLDSNTINALYHALILEKLSFDFVQKEIS